jgi:squalene cyclase
VILAHQCPDGGFRTYLPASGIRQFIEADEHEDLSGWCSSHLCVTCVAVQTLFITGVPVNSTAIQSALNFIRERQTEGGYWNSYWFHGKAYGTAHAIRALRLMGDDGDTPRLIQAKEWLENNQATNGSWQDNGSPNAFETALAIRALIETPSPSLPRIRQGIAWLLQQQCPDGSWASRPILQVPATSDHAPWERRNWARQGLTGILVADHNRVFTTATILQGLAGWKKHEQKGEDK